MKTYLVLIALCLSVNVAMAQKKALYRQRVIFNHGISYSLPFNKISTNSVADKLTTVNDKGFGIQFFSFNWFVKENFGVELLLHGTTNSTEKKRQKEFVSQVEGQFTSQYYTDMAYIFEFEQSLSIKKFTAALGANYKIERHKFTCIPKFFVGVLATEQMSVMARFMKERNTNNVMRLDYEGQPHSKGRLLLAPAATLMYRFNNILGVSFNAFYWWHNADVNYSETITDIATDKATINRLSNDKTLHGLNLGLSLSLGFGKRRDLVTRR